MAPALLLRGRGHFFVFWMGRNDRDRRAAILPDERETVPMLSFPWEATGGPGGWQSRGRLHVGIRNSPRPSQSYEPQWRAERIGLRRLGHMIRRSGFYASLALASGAMFASAWAGRVEGVVLALIWLILTSISEQSRI